MRLLRHIAVMLAVLWASTAQAQDSDKDWLTRQIQDALSGLPGAAKPACESRV